MKSVLTLLTLLVFTNIIFSDPWTDDDFTYARAESVHSCYFSYAVIRGQPFFREENMSIKSGTFTNLLEQPTLLLLIAGAVAVIKACKHLWSS